MIVPPSMMRAVSAASRVARMGKGVPAAVDEVPDVAALHPVFLCRLCRP